MDVKVQIDLSTMNAKRTIVMEGKSMNKIIYTLPGECKKDFQIYVGN